MSSSHSNPMTCPWRSEGADSRAANETAVDTRNLGAAMMFLVGSPGSAVGAFDTEFRANHSVSMVAYSAPCDALMRIRLTSP